MGARVGLLLAGWGTFASSGRAAAQEVVWERIGVGAEDGVGKWIDRIPDWNGDGIDDLVVSAPGDDAAFADAGSWTIHDARDGAELRTLLGLAAREQVAFAFPFDDVDGDGRIDLVEQLGSDRSYRLRSGASGVAIWGARRVHNRVPVAVDDLDGDGIREIATGSAGLSAGFPIHFYSGRTGLVVGLIQAPSQASKKFATTMTAVPDQDGDGRVDLVVGDPDRGAGSKSGWVGLYSTGSGALLAQVAGAGPEELGAEVRLHGDIDGDGDADLLVFAATEKSASGLGTGVVRFWSVAGLAEVDRLEPTAGTKWSSSRSIGDVDGDGCADLALREWKYSLESIEWIWSTRAKRKLRGICVRDMEVSSIASAPDLDGDGDEEIAWGDALAPDHAQPNSDHWEEGLARVERSGPAFLTVLPKIPTRQLDRQHRAGPPPGPSADELPDYFHTAFAAGFAPGARVTLRLVSFNGTPWSIPAGSAIAAADGSAEIAFAHGFTDADHVEYQAFGLGPGGAVVATGPDWCGALR